MTLCLEKKSYCQSSRPPYYFLKVLCWCCQEQRHEWMMNWLTSYACTSMWVKLKTRYLLHTKTCFRMLPLCISAVPKQCEDSGLHSRRFRMFSRYDFSVAAFQPHPLFKQVPPPQKKVHLIHKEICYTSYSPKYFYISLLSCKVSITWSKISVLMRWDFVLSSLNKHRKIRKWIHTPGKECCDIYKFPNFEK